MLDPIALLQSLTLPAGATTGRRIVIDGTNGLIRVYDTNGTLRIQLSDPSVARAARMLLFSGAPAGDELQGGDIFATVLNSGAANEKLVLDIDAPQPNWGTLFPTIALLTEAKDGSDLSKIQLVADQVEFVGLTHKTNIFREDGRFLPLGTMATPNETSTAATAAAVETKDTNLGDYVFTAVAGRRYRIMCHGRLQLSVAGQADLRIRDGGAGSPTTASTQVAAASSQIPNTTGGQHVMIAKERTFTAGTHTLAAFYAQTAGGGNCSFGQAGGETRQLWVEDVGS